MHRTLKVAAAVAVISVGGIAVSRVMVGPNEGDVALGAEASHVGEDWAFFTGKTYANGTPVPNAPAPFEEGGLFVVGSAWTGQTITTDDPRMTGTRSEYITSFEDAPDGSTKGMVADLIVIANADGSWTCPSYGVMIDPDAGWALSGWCEGAGGYEGLRAFVRYDYDEGESWLDVNGFITSGDGPAMPEAPAS